jgi:hypothetical protein
MTGVIEIEPDKADIAIMMLDVETKDLSINK